MPNFIIALIVVFGGLWLIRKFAKTSPSQAAGPSVIASSSAAVRLRAGWFSETGANVAAANSSSI